MPKCRINSGPVFLRHRPSSRSYCYMETAQLVLSQFENVLTYQLTIE